MLVYAATKNRGKLAELRAIFSAAGWTVENSTHYADVVEGDESYVENAALKARSLHATLVAAGRPAAVIGDDSGLEVSALGGRPGVLSARYGGDGATWAERRRALLGEVERSGSANRSARFVCALHFIDPSGGEIAVVDTLSGRLADRERGDGGFSYDAIFVPDESTATFAELAEAEKNRISHRARAAQELLARIATRDPAKGLVDRSDSGPCAG